ncbi:MAG TPA: triose-phosphate isomerase, partial [Actinomycetes bacterium]|nr:triose-phosphate isomerase [Actinomycetes bacterium]
EVATPEDAQEVCSAIRKHIAETHGPEAAAGIRVLYGGSVKAANAPGIMAQKDVDGALVGGASLIAEEFVGIVTYRNAATADAGTSTGAGS